MYNCNDKQKCVPVILLFCLPITPKNGVTPQESLVLTSNSINGRHRYNK